MTLKEFCSVWTFDNIDRIAVNKNDHFVFEDGFLYPNEMMQLIYSNDDIANLRVIDSFIYKNEKMSEYGNPTTLFIDVVDSPNVARLETFEEFENRIFGKGKEDSKLTIAKDKVKKFFKVEKDDSEELTKYKKDPYFWMKFMEEN